jgi:RNA polymerase sigma-70 factor (ECF subfamily)
LRGRLRTHHVEAGNAVERLFQRCGHEALDLGGSQAETRNLDLHARRCEFGEHVDGSLANRADAEEAMQEAFIRLLYKAPVFAEPEHEKRWLLRITVNLCKDKLKGFWRKKVVPTDDFKTYVNEPEDLQLAELVLSMPHKYKTVIHLYYYENYNVKEISLILRISASAVKMRLKRGRELLKFELEGSDNAQTGL